MSKENNATITSLVNSALVAELIAKLAELGVLSEQDTHDVYDRALESLERMQADADDPDFRAVCADARRMIEEPWSTTPRRFKN